MHLLGRNLWKYYVNKARRVDFLQKFAFCELLFASLSEILTPVFNGYTW